MYWRQYVQHDNNRDGIGQYLKLTQNLTKGVLDWHPTVVHDLHEALSHLYISTGTGPYNPSLDPVQSDEWWLLAETEVLEMAKRKVPGVWTYGFYDGWVPNYLFWIANTHNSLGRFYKVQSYGPDIKKGLKLEPAVTSREWYRPNPPLPTIDWGPRNNTNIQEYRDRPGSEATPIAYGFKKMFGRLETGALLTPDTNVAPTHPLLRHHIAASVRLAVINGS